MMRSMSNDGAKATQCDAFLVSLFGDGSRSGEVKSDPTQFATLTLPNGKSCELPLLTGSAGPSVIDGIASDVSLVSED